MAIDFTYATNVLNSKGKLRLITSLELYARVPDLTDPELKYEVPVGMAQQFDVNESRQVIYNFVIGNTNPARCRDLVPGAIQRSTVQLHFVSLYTTNGIGLFVTPNPTKYAFSPSVPDNTRPFDLVERWMDASTGLTVYEIIYKNCYIEQYTAPKNMTTGADLRVVENMTIHYQDVSFVPASDFEAQIDSGTMGNPFN